MSRSVTVVPRVSVKENFVQIQILLPSKNHLIFFFFVLPGHTGPKGSCSCTYGACLEQVSGANMHAHTRTHTRDVKKVHVSKDIGGDTASSMSS